ncbi:MAG TPA: lipopolysaccharide heptosyltransferase II [Pyrinomonadaceae bacterium]|nr:lipopolysaccharide heptosyltransferase II [Pyrinomonadaceae bacterium]
MKRSKLKAEDIKRVVVRGTNWVGDAVMTIPALRELRRVLPGAHLTLVTRSWSEGLFRDADFLDQLLIYDRRGMGSVARATRQWRSQSFDLAILFQNAFEAALIAAVARVPVRVGYGTDGRRALLTHALPLPSWHGERHEVFYYLNIIYELEKLLRGSSDVMEREPRFDLRVNHARQAEATELLKAHGASLNGASLNGAGMDGPLIALCPGSTNSRAKRWPSERYAALADRFVDEMRARVVLVGSAEEVEVSHAVAGQMRRQPVMLTGRTDLSEAVAVLSIADLLITNDTGPAHIAAALERPTLVIFGPTDPTTTRPFSQRAQLIRRPPECAPCMLRDCPIDHRCMTAITPDEVFARACEMMKRASPEVAV